MAKQKPPFTKTDLPDETSYSMSDCDFANYFVRFVQSDFAETIFTKRFYKRLMYEFSHIAHYNQMGFYDEWFRTTADRVRFLKHTLDLACGGYTPVERAIQRWLRANNMLAAWQARLTEETEVCERAALAILKRKYELETVTPAPTRAPTPTPTLTPTAAPVKSKRRKADAPEGVAQLAMTL